MKILIAPYSQKLRPPKEKQPNPKNYPWWPELITLLKDHDITQIGIAGEVPLVPLFVKTPSYDHIKELINKNDFWISVDSFLPHLARFTDKKGVVLWGPSDPIIYGYKENLNILKDRANLRTNQFGIWEELDYKSDIFVSPEEVYKKIKDFFVIT